MHYVSFQAWFKLLSAIAFRIIELCPRISRGKSREKATYIMFVRLLFVYLYIVAYNGIQCAYNANSIIPAPRGYDSKFKTVYSLGETNYNFYARRKSSFVSFWLLFYSFLRLSHTSGHIFSSFFLRYLYLSVNGDLEHEQ